ncbi:DUF4097 and DUF4098 domain-containing protein YvlB [Desulfitispora alkaliphila]|uniref:DUF4097 family beta strand repeat-containing protein n=1 Tax=Desulfitispora alkaliphila TaxID=622674 RepID=UPI003D2101FA
MKKIGIVLLVLIMFLISGCSLDNINFVEETSSGTLQCNEFVAGSISIENRNGSVRIEQWDQNYIKIHYDKKASAITEVDLATYLEETIIDIIEEQDSVEIRTIVPEIKRGNVSVSMRIHVPESVNLDVITSNGSITVEPGIQGDLKLRSSNGRIKVEGHIGEFDLETSNGSVNVNDVNGGGKIRTSNGSINIEYSNEANLLGQEYDIRASNGKITVIFPDELGFDLDARTSNGSIKSKYQEIDGKIVKERINGGGFKLNLETSNGSIYINN